MDLFYWKRQYMSIYERLEAAGHTSRIYYYDQASSTLEVVNLLRNSRPSSGCFRIFLMPAPGTNSPSTASSSPTTLTTTRQTVQRSGSLATSIQTMMFEQAKSYTIATNSAIPNYPNLWANTALLIVYDEHGGTQ